MFALKRVALAFLAGPPLLLSAYAVDASAIYGVNHTHWAINRFSVDGRSAVDIIGPYQGGGGGCCYGAPERWYPGLTVRVDWENGCRKLDRFSWDRRLVQSSGLERKNPGAEAQAKQSRPRPGLHRPGRLRHHRAFPALR